MNKGILKALVVVYWVVYALPCLSQEGDLKTIEALRKSPKLYRPELVLENFVKGERWTRVTVALAEPKDFKRRDLNELGAEKAHKDAVKSALDKVINRLDSNGVVTYRSKYGFLFSADVTLKGIEELTKMREVIQIRRKFSKEKTDQAQARLESMRQDIIEFIGEPTCSDSSDCRYIALGDKPYGGPWEYLIYSASKVDSLKVQSMVDSFNRLNKELYRRYDWLSIPNFLTAPNLGCREGLCVDVGR